MRSFSCKPWNIYKDPNYYPFISIIVPAYNEEENIQLKLMNLKKLKYPRDKLQIILVNDGSTDHTLQKMYEFQKSNAEIKIEILSHTKRAGKTTSLNLALKKVKGEIVVVSDADCFLSPNILLEAVPFFADPSVGGVTALEVLLNPKESWVTETENFYNNFVHTTRVGESKVYSTIFFQGGFGAYKRFILDEFDAEADDSGTALEIVQKGARTILLPSATYFTVFPSNWKGKFATKIRRAGQLIKIWVRCLKLFLQGRLTLPKRIFIPEAFLFLVNPFIFIFLILISFLAILESPLLLLVFSAFLVATISLKRIRISLFETLQCNIIVLCAIISSALGKDFRFWSTLRSSKVHVNEDLLRSLNLI